MSRPSSSRSTGSRPPTPQESRASITVPMGGLGWMSKTGAYTLITSAGGYHTINGTSFPDRVGMFTKGMSSCFSVIIAGSGGAVIAHVSGYLGHPNLSTAHKAELKAMKDGFAQIWTATTPSLPPTPSPSSWASSPTKAR
ncbi:hypothetical protein B0I37DRAFT_354428 [Chaetomium sp. MPI-CAGE-AT-0009]|nr:hypothetical protein B0I37DRAFT_354428 [Chaetomium sp. MPI-CAGE-AT-0009]